MDYIIREYQPADAAGVQECIVELQDFERTIDARLRSGAAIATEYCQQIEARCRHAAGRMFVAEHDGGVIGFVAVMAHEPFTELDDPPGTYGLITDLVVRTPFRKRGIGRKLLDRAEAFARAAGASELRLAALAANDAARRLYRAAAFVPHVEIFSKRW